MNVKHVETVLVSAPVTMPVVVRTVPVVKKGTLAEVEEMVHKLNTTGFGDDFILKIIKCEGELYNNEWQPNYNIRNGVVWSTDYGPLQVNDFYHKKDMEKLGLDITVWQDSLKYGLMLLKRDGTRHWNASRDICWNKSAS